jgi:hypothetical protein
MLARKHVPRLRHFKKASISYMTTAAVLNSTDNVANLEKHHNPNKYSSDQSKLPAFIANLKLKLSSSVTGKQARAFLLDRTC